MKKFAGVVRLLWRRLKKGQDSEIDFSFENGFWMVEIAPVIVCFVRKRGEIVKLEPEID